MSKEKTYPELNKELQSENEVLVAKNTELSFTCDNLRAINQELEDNLISLKESFSIQKDKAEKLFVELNTSKQECLRLSNQVDITNEKFKVIYCENLELKEKLKMLKRITEQSINVFFEGV